VSASSEDDDPVQRLRSRGVAATANGRPAVGARHLRRALVLLGPEPPDRELRGRILLSLAYAEAEQGQVQRGRQLLDEAAGWLTDKVLLHAQRGVFLVRIGCWREAIDDLDLAVAGLRTSGPPEELARALLNRGTALMSAGELARCRADLLELRRVARSEGLVRLQVKATNSLGYLDLLGGNLPRALRRLDAAALMCAEHLPSYLPTILANKAEALLAAGLHTEAGRELDAAIEVFRRQRQSHELAEAELTRASAALLGGLFEDAQRWADSARARFTRRHSHSWAQLAALVALRADLARGQPPVPLARRGMRLARALAGLGLADEARIAHLLAVRAWVRAGLVSRAVTVAAGVPAPTGSDPLDLWLLWHLAHAELARAAGDTLAQDGQLRAGLARLHHQRTQLGSIEMRSGVAVHGRELAGTGLSGALARGDVAGLFEWAELIRAQAFRVPPVRPPSDPVAAGALEELRQVVRALREAELRDAAEGRADTGPLRSRRTALERTVRERAWLHAGPGASTAVADLPAVLDRLGTDAMVIYLRSEGALVALVLVGGAARLVPLGPYATAEEQLRRLHVDLDTAAERALPGRMREVVHAAAIRDARLLSGTLLTPVLPLVGDRKIVVVPTGALFTVPWSRLPGCAGRPVVVAPSATAWATASDRPAGTPGQPVLIAGPGLDHGAREVASIAVLHPGARCLTAERATPAAALAALDGTGLAHVAAHGHHEPDNPLFSAFDLAGGPLMGYDLQRLARPPRHVVMSTCELGLSSVRTGDEILGMVAALLAAGSTTVIASVSRPLDSTLPEVMVPYHRLLSAGEEPARALAATTDHGSFVCFGYG
jgi:tetratricopeptide (TPR) repeat protein